MTLISELIDVPLQVQDGDFVLKLTQGIGTDSQATVADYVVTDDLRDAFDAALGLVASAVSDGQSKAAYLHGSFGSGKSHFMAMLHLLLRHDTNARSKPELHEVIDKWGTKLDNKTFLQVPVHFLDARSVEQKILGGYVETIEKEHPGVALPSVYLGDEIVVTELPKLRDRIGDEALLAGLNSTGPGEDEWGEFAEKWTVEGVDAALAAPATDQRRQELVSSYISAFRSGTVLESASTGEGFVDLDRGLGAISRHAQELGYDGIVLFLDELILWLASNIGDMRFVQRESQKLTKLVEATDAGRPVPIVSFIARQRDLRDLVGDHIAGAEQRSLADNLELQQGRFGSIELASGNLPVVAKQRLLAPVDDRAADSLSKAVDQALGGREEIKRQLLGTTADAELFRTVYPFSPALIQALVDVSEALQRERTALKVMLQLLVDQRDTLQVGEIIPVGDLWDVVASRDEPFSSELKSLFEIAKRLWRTKIYPMLEAVNSVDDDTPPDAPERQALKTDSRLLKTVLLAALVPEVEAFRGLDAARLSALNWGSITTPIPGQETQLVAQKLRRLAANIGELTIGDDAVNPTISIRLANVDTEEIISRARETFDNAGTRRTAVRNLIGAALNDRIGDDLRGTLVHEWRGGPREVDVVFGNVRDAGEMADNTLIASPDRPKLIVDFPFDTQGRSPDDDLERLDDWSQRHEPTTAVCWLPSFFSTQGLETLGRYIAVSEVLKQDRFEQFTSQLSATQRAEAKPLIENLHNELRGQLNNAILSAYGVVSLDNALVDTAASLSKHYRSLDPAMEIRPTTQPTLEGALGQLCDQILASLYPGHPEFEGTVTNASLRTTWSEIQRALADPDNRAIVESSNRRTLRLVANPLKLGTMHESHFVLDTYWRNQLDRYLNDASPDTPATVSEMRAWIDAVPGGPRGLAPKVADLIVLTVAAQTNHRLVDHGATFAPQPGTAMPGDVKLIPEQLPSDEEWSDAVSRASAVLGLTFNQRVTGPEVASMGNQVRDSAKALAADADELVAQLSSVYKEWGLAQGDRLDTALAARDLVRSLERAEDNAVVALLASFDAPTSDRAAGTSLKSARTIAGVLRGANIKLWQTARPAVENDATQALQTDQIVLDLQPAEVQIEAAATAFVGQQSPPSHAEAPDQPVDLRRTDDSATSPPKLVERRIESAAELDNVLGELQAAVQEGPIIITWNRSG